MKVVQSLLSIALGLVIAVVILNMVPSVSTFQLEPMPLEYSDENLMLVGAGLATQTSKPSVMDADTGPAPSVVLMTDTAMSPAPLTTVMSDGTTSSPAPPATVVNSPTPMAPFTASGAQPTMMPPPMQGTQPTMMPPMNPSPSA